MSRYPSLFLCIYLLGNHALRKVELSFRVLSYFLLLFSRIKLLNRYCIIATQYLKTKFLRHTWTYRGFACLPHDSNPNTSFTIIRQINNKVDKRDHTFIPAVFYSTGLFLALAKLRAFCPTSYH